MYRIELGDCIELMKSIPDGSIDLTVTSPPYDNLRTYENSIEWNFKIFTRIAKELYRVTKEGGVVVWVVGDATINGSETAISFRQALFFKRIGFNLHDTMIYKRASPFCGNVRYYQDFEYMFVLSKGKVKTFNPLQEKKSYRSFGSISKTYRQKDGTMKGLDERGLERIIKGQNKLTKDKSNIWDIKAGFMITTCDVYAYEHPAIFPDSLANDHILSWSNEGDTVLDPFLGSGTTAKMAIRNNRNFIGFEKVEKYFKIAERRILEEIDKTALFNYDKAS